MMQYPRFQALGWPIGDGAVESGNKLVVEARLKGSGMHWALAHVNPMLALRNVACNDRWQEAWPQIALTLRQQDRLCRSERRKARHTPQVSSPESTAESPAIPNNQTVVSTTSLVQTNKLRRPAKSSAQDKPSKPWRPPADHPWRHMPLGKARLKPGPGHTDPKT